MAAQFSPSEWKTIHEELTTNPDKYGFPKRVYGSVVLGSFNIRKLGSPRNRNSDTWDFLARVCRQFDLLAVQEVMDEIDGLKRLMELLGPEFGLIVSDTTGVFPGDRGLGERLAFIFRWSVVKRGEVVSDVTYDRSKMSNILMDNFLEIREAREKYLEAMDRYGKGLRKTRPTFSLPVFMSFIRQPFCVSFEIKGFPGTKPYRFMAVNAHLIYGTTEERKDEFQALMEWIIGRVKEDDRTYHPNFVLLGDLNLDFNKPETDFAVIERYLKSFDSKLGKQVNVNFPFLDIHPKQQEQFTSNVKLTERYDQIGFFFREDGLPTYLDNDNMGSEARGPDFGVFNFTELFAQATLGKSYGDLSSSEKKGLVDRYQHKVSDHMPIWVRLPLPDAD